MATRSLGMGRGPGRQKVGNSPLISCIMLTGDRPEFMVHAARLFVRQTYPTCELIIVDDGESMPAYIPQADNIRYFRLPAGLTEMERLSYGLTQGRGTLYAFWDDQAWHNATRLQLQATALAQHDAESTLLTGAPSLDLRRGTFRPADAAADPRTFLMKASAWDSSFAEWQDFAAEILQPKRDRLVLPNDGIWFPLIRGAVPALSSSAIASPAIPAEDRKFYRGFAVRQPHARAARRTGTNARPLVSCIMPTANRRAFVPFSVRLFLEQDYPNRELIIIDDGEDPIPDILPGDSSIRYFRVNTQRSVGAKRNLACEYARGEIILHWDDDDWSASWRISHQVDHLLRTKADICGLANVYFLGPGDRQAWLYTYPSGERPWVCGGTLCYRRELWERSRFPDISVGEDNAFVWSTAPKLISPISNPQFYAASIHPGNTSTKSTWDTRWTLSPVERIRGFMGTALDELLDLISGREVPHPSLPPPAGGTESALLTLGAGIGDILRATPLIRVLHGLGYEVDVAVETDYSEVISLLEGAPEIRALFHRSSPWSGHRGHTTNDLRGLGERVYSVSLHAPWTQSSQFPFTARKRFEVQPDEWINRGISYAVGKLAEQVGWRGALPGNVVMPSTRRFDVPKHAVAIHPGCKPGWPWKKWHGFDALATLFPEVVIVGTAEDLQNHGTYFDRQFAWPSHARSFVGSLGLRDTAALLGQCAALISNDSGIMHLAAALGIPTFGIFGITSPGREAMPLPNLFPITKQLPCEPACRLAPARRDCELHLQCLKTLTPQEVFARVSSHLPKVESQPAPRHPIPPINGSWYNASYFESEGSGGWADGYHWHILGGRYTRLAQFLTSQIPGDAIFLDACCGKGFLVKALLRQNRECAGFDASAFAVDHAVEDARAFIQLAGVDDFPVERSFDVLLLIDCLEHLTLEQASAFLARSRYFITGCALAAFEHPAARRRDLGRITQRPAEWWHDVFMQAGWKQDFVHRQWQGRLRHAAVESGIELEFHVYAP